MRSIKWLIAAGLIVATTAACTEQYGYPTTAYNSGGYYNSGTGYYNSGSGYYSNNRYYNNSGHAYHRTPRRGPYGDYDRDGVPNRYDHDANGDGIPDRYQH